MLQSSPHRDVLEAPIPDADSSKRGLLEELKNRGRAAVGSKAWPDGEMLYEKALKIVESLPSATDNEVAILHSNLSLTLAKMGKFHEAGKSALDATKRDHTYVKGWWRLSTAHAGLKEYQQAVEAMEKAMELDPGNKALTKELSKLKELAEKAALEPEKVPEGPKTEPAPPLTAAAKKAVAEGNSKTAKDVEMKEANNDHEEDEEDKSLFSKSEPVRGYKIVNGKKTSYFHNELSEDAKKLIGDIAPKKLDPATAPAPIATGDKSTSAWNQAGTWEERDVTAWAKESLSQALQLTTYTLPESAPAPGALARINKVKEVDGHASFATVRGRKKYIYEFKIELEWVLDLPSEPDAAKGEICFPDVDGTCELGKGYDIDDYHVTAIDEQSLRPVLDRFVKNSGLRDSLHETIDEWVRQFREKY